jgi:hypothetical protein
MLHQEHDRLIGSLSEVYSNSGNFNAAPFDVSVIILKRPTYAIYIRKKGC